MTCNMVTTAENTAPNQNPFCVLCDELNHACVYHSAEDEKTLRETFFEDLRRSKALGLARYFAAFLANLERGIPDRVLGIIRNMPIKPIEKEFARIVQLEEISGNDLRWLAAICLTLAQLYEEKS